MNNYNKILILQTAFLGDAIMSTGFIKAARKLFPQAQIDVLCIPQTKDVFTDNPNLDSIITFDKRKWNRKLLTFPKTVFLLRRNRYKLAFSLQPSMSSSLILLLSGIPVRIGFARQKLLTHPQTVRKRIPIVKRYLELLNPFSAKDLRPETEVFWKKDVEVDVDKKIRAFEFNPDKTIAIAPGSIRFTKKWLLDYFISLCKMLQQDGIKAFFIGGKEDMELCKTIILQSGISAFNLAGMVGLKGSAYLLTKVPLLLCNDSAPLHLANAVRTDVIAIFGPTVELFGCFPYRMEDVVLQRDMDCRPCNKHGGNKCPQRHFKCMLEIKPEEVYAVIMKKLRKRK